jgi:stage III sporulation protein SpoIIIAA
VNVAPAEDLEFLLACLPDPVARALAVHPRKDALLEVVLDLGRPPEARFPGDAEDLVAAPVGRDDLALVVARIGRFGKDNRAGIERTLHRISAIRNRVGDVVGLTCRVGRAVFGTVDVVRDVIESGQSLLLLGRPGVGKTTLLREAARVLADEARKRVVVVDTSNEIAGDGDIPHPGIGRARRMQVAVPEAQHAVMIEAVENHMPEVVVIDEIGTEAEAAAARTIAERGVQLVATAHGVTLDNLLQNPTLSDLVGGIQVVTLSDEEARRRGSQKTVLERKAPPTFDVVIEIQEKDRLAVHHEVAEVVDLLLRGIPARPELRLRDADGRVEIQSPGAGRRAARTTARAGVARPAGAEEERFRFPPGPDREQPGGEVGSGGERLETALPGPRRELPDVRPPTAYGARAGVTGARAVGAGNGGAAASALAPRNGEGGTTRDGGRDGRPRRSLRTGATVVRKRPPSEPPPGRPGGPWLTRPPAVLAAPPSEPAGGRRLLRIHPYAVSRARLEKTLADLGLPARVVRDPDDADVLLTTKAQERRQPRRLREATARGLRVVVLKANTGRQIDDWLRSEFGMAPPGSPGRELEGFALREAEEAIDEVMASGEPVELAPQERSLRRLQHLVVERAGLASMSRGEEPNRRVVVLPG